MNPNPKSNIENFSNTIEEKFKITELEEKFSIKVSPEDLKKYKDAIFSKKEVEKIQTWVASISELAKTKLAILKEKARRQEQVKKSQEFLKNTLKKSKEESNKAAEKITKAIEELGNSEITKDTKEKWAELTKKTKETVKKVAKNIEKSWYTAQLWAAFKDAFEKLKNFDIWWFIVTLFKWFFWIYTGKEIVKKAKELLDSNTDEYKNTLSKLQNTVINRIEKTPWITLKNEDKDYIKKMLSPNIQWSYISTEEFKKLIQKVKSWEEITPQDIKNLKILDKISKDKNLEHIFENIVNENIKKIAKYLDKQYWVKTDTPENFKKFQQIAKDSFNFWELIHFNKETKEISWEIRVFDILIWVPKNIFIFFISLAWAWLIDASRFIFKAWEKWKDIISVWLEAISWWQYLEKIFTSLNFEDLYWSIDQLSEVEKWIMIRLFQRNIDTFLLPIHYWIKSISSLWLMAWEALWKWDFFSTRIKPIFESNEKIVTRIENIYTKLWVKNAPWELKHIQEAMNYLKESYKILDDKTLSNATKTAKIEVLIGKIKWLDDLYTKSTSIWSSLDIKDSKRFFKPSNYITSELLNEIKWNLEINKAQASWLFGKIKSTLKLDFFKKWKIESIWDKSLLYFDNSQKFRDFLHTIAKEWWSSITPKILSRTWWIVVSWVIFNEIKNWNFKEALSAAVPFMWPALLLNEWTLKFNWKWYDFDWKIIDWRKTAIWASLLAVDWWFLIHDVITKWFLKWIWYNFWRYYFETRELIHDSKKLYQIWKKFIKWEKQIIKFAELIKRIPKYWKIWSGLILATAAVYGFEQDNPIKTWKEEWILTEKWLDIQKLKEKIKWLNNEELENGLNILYGMQLSNFSHDPSKFNLKIENNKIIIKSIEWWYSKEILKEKTKLNFELLLNELWINKELIFE